MLIAMHYLRLASLLLGAWLCGSLFTMTVSTRKYTAVDEMLLSPKPNLAEQIESLRREPARQFLRHLATLQNTAMIENWERAQFALGILLMLTLFFGLESKPWLLVFAVVMFAALCLQHWQLTPQIVQVSRMLDVTATGTPPAEQTRLNNYHSAYAITEIVKVGLGGLMALGLAKRRRHRSRRVEGEIDMIDDADHSHING